MAISFDANIGIQSVLGFKRPSGFDNLTGYRFDAPRPVMQTTRTLNGEEFTDTGINTGTRVLFADPLADFSVPSGSTSTNQTVILRNFGNAMLTITNIAFTANGVIPVPTFSPLTLSTGKIEIAADSSATFQLAYYSTQQGIWANSLLITSNIDTTFYRVPTRQIVDPNFSLSISPSSAVKIGTTLGEKIDQVYQVTPIINTVPSDVIVPLVTSIASSSPAWSVNKIETNELTGKQEITLRFRAVDVNNVNGTYNSTLTVTSTYGFDTAVSSVNTQVQLNIDYSRFNPLGTWVSPAAPDNSVIGISYDMIDDIRYLTIGVGTGGDGTPIYSQGGAPFTGTNALGILATASDYNYFAWATVYKFVIPDNQAVRYFSGEQNREGVYLYRVKPELTEEGTYPETETNYESYFGLESSPGSMFIVDSDQYGNVSIALNQLRSLNGDPGIDKTLKNLTRAFHYYSNVDEPSRYYQLDAAPIQDGNVTRKFNGFNNSGTVLTSVVPLPLSF
jgi:hypothetical protein